MGLHRIAHCRGDIDAAAHMQRINIAARGNQQVGERVEFLLVVARQFAAIPAAPARAAKPRHDVVDKEELQSINEEPQTLNNELKLKLDMVSRAHNDLQNPMSASDICTMFLNSNLGIEQFSPRMAELFNIVPGDEGRPVTARLHDRGRTA